MGVSLAIRVVKVLSKAVEVSRVEEPKVKVVVGDTGVVQASKLEGRRTHSPIGEPLSLALENVAILWWAPHQRIGG